jgi:hypothetical protein
MINRHEPTGYLANRPQTPPRHGRHTRRPLGVTPERPPYTVDALDPDAGIATLGGGLVHGRAQGLKAAIEARKYAAIDAHRPAVVVIGVIGNLIDPGHERYQPW